MVFSCKIRLMKNKIIIYCFALKYFRLLDYNCNKLNKEIINNYFKHVNVLLIIFLIILTIVFFLI